MICLIPTLEKWDLCFVNNTFLWNNPSPGDINPTNLPCLTFDLPSDTSDSRNSSCYLYFMFIFVMLSCLFLPALWWHAGKWLTSWLSCVWCFLVFLLLCLMVTRVECGTRFLIFAFFLTPILKFISMGWCMMLVFNPFLHDVHATLHSLCIIIWINFHVGTNVHRTKKLLVRSTSIV